MFTQTVDQLLPLLQLLRQPAFCLRHDGSVVCNHEARPLAPASGKDLPTWLGNSAELYDRWQGEAPLTLPVSLFAHSASVTVQPLADGNLFLLSLSESLSAGSDPFSVTAQVLRQPLSDLSGLAQSLAEELEETEDPLLLNRTAAITRQIYRLSRIAANLSDLERLRSGSYQPRMEKLALLPYLQELTEEMGDICRSAGRSFTCRLPAKPINITADPKLLERGILNLLSNAIKYSDPADPIAFVVDTTVNSLLLQMKNTCSTADSDLLTAAFQRLNQRGLLPDPQWGLGLGLPMTRYIAQLLGGTVAVEVKEEKFVTVTMSISRKKAPTEVQSQQRPPIDYTGGMRPSLVELSDVLPDSCFDSISL